MDPAQFLPRGFGLGATLASLQDWFIGKTTQDTRALKLQDASRLLTEQRGPSPAVTMPRSNFYINGMNIPLMTRPPALSNANTPAATPASDQASISLFSAFCAVAQRDEPSTAVSAFAHNGASTSAMAPPATPHNANQFHAHFTPAFALSNNGDASGYTAPLTPPSSAFEFTASSTIAHASHTALSLQHHRRPAPRAHTYAKQPDSPGGPSSAFDFTASPTVAHTAQSPKRHRAPDRPTPRAHPYARLPGSPGGDCVQEEQPTEALKKNKHIQRFKRREEFIDHRVFGEQATVGSSASAPDGGREDVSMELYETPAAQQGKVDDDFDGSRAHEDEGPVTPALGNDSTPAIHGFDDFHNDDDADPFAADDGMDIADDADRAKYSGVNRERTANDFYFPSSPASSSSSIHTAAHADEASVTPALANLPAPDIPGFGDFVMYDGVNDGATPSGDAELEQSTNATREPTANAALQSHTASAVAAPVPPPPFVLTVHPPSPRLDEVDEDELRQAHAALNKDGKIWLDCTSTGFIIAFINSGEAITSLSLEYMDPREGDLGLTIRLVDNLARDIVFTNVETDMLSHLQNSSTIVACTEVSIDLSLRSPHYHALATTTLPRVTLLRAKVSRNQDSGALDDDLVVLRLPLVQTIMHCVPPPAVSDAQASTFVNRHVEHNGTALVFAM